MFTHDNLAQVLFVYIFVIGKEDYKEWTDMQSKADCWRQSTQGSDQIKQKQGIKLVVMLDYLYVQSSNSMHLDLRFYINERSLHKSNHFFVIFYIS